LRGKILDALKTIEGLGLAEDEAQYAEHLRNGGIDWKRLQG
jgi:hypothetical protein